MPHLVAHGPAGRAGHTGGQRMTSTVNGTASAVPGQRELALRDQGGTGKRAAERPQFLTGKVSIPRPSFPVLHRRRVSRLLDEAARHRVTLVSGPAGAGK